MGNGGTAQSNVPVSPTTGGITGFTHFKKVSLGTRHTCGITNTDQLYCWGMNTEGRVGNGTLIDVLVPAAVAFASATTVKTVAAGSASTCALKTDDTMECWGAGNEGQLGNGVATLGASAPIPASAANVVSLSTLADLSAGNGFCGRITAGNVYCWGASEAGQLATSETVFGPTKVDVSALTGSRKFSKISAGDYHMCGIAEDERTYCWGSGSSGQIGNGASVSVKKPTTIDSSLLPVGVSLKEVSAGGSHSCGLGSNKKVYCWGENSDGQLGNNSIVTSNVPVAVDTSDMPADKNFIQVATGTWQTCGIAEDFAAHCWGYGGYRALGYGSNASKLRPFPVATAGIAGSKNFAQIKSAQRHSCAVMSDGEGYCWGEGNAGRLGTGVASTVSVPTIISKTNMTTGSAVISSLSIGEAHGCLQTADAQQYCWGYNVFGQLGDGTTSNAVAPVKSALVTVTPADFTASRQHATFFIGKTNQLIYGIGYGIYGQLGFAPRRTSTTFVNPLPVY